MKFFARAIFAAVLTWTAAAAATAQKLPTGVYHAHSERAYDLLHLKAELAIDPAAGRVEGRAILEIEPLKPIDRLEIGAVGLEVASVRSGTAELKFEADGRKLKVELPATAGPGEPFHLTVDYAATPRAGMYFQGEHENPERVIVSTYGEGGLHANWVPIYNDVNDKFPTEMVITVPEPYVVISNGVLVEERDAGGGRRTFHWRQELPHPNYLISLYVGDFERGELEPAFGEIPLAYWVPRGRLAEGAYAFRNTTRMVEFYSERFSYRYPWDKYDQIAVPDYAVGAMEHTGVTGHQDSVLRLAGEAPWDFGAPTFDEYWTDWSAEATISHELAHHWFGDNLTCRNLSQIWLNESFASYLMMLWDEESVGRDQLLFDVELARRHYVRYVDTDHLIRPLEYAYFDNTDVIYNVEHTYLKGGAVLHMLRAVLGDETFFRALGEYMKRHEFENVTSEDLLRALEDTSGRNLRWFFDDWVYGGGHPIFEVSYRYLEDRKAIDLEIEQVQALVKGQDYFKLPVEVVVETPSKRWTETLWVEGEKKKVLLKSAEKPRMVSFDGAGHLVAEIRFEKELPELVHQAGHDALPGRLRALAQLAERFPARPETRKAFEAALSGDGFWALQAEAAELLGRIRTPAAEKLAEKALASSDYRVRKAAVLALRHFGAREKLREVVAGDSHSDVVGTAVVALARTDPKLDAAFLKEQLARESWYDEIRIAALTAAGELARPDLLELVRPYAGARWNMDVRQAALGAWEAISPTDGDLHAALRGAARGPILPLQLYALEKLGTLYVEDAVPYLEGLVKHDFDDNLTVAAKKALKEIRRVRGTKAPG